MKRFRIKYAKGDELRFTGNLDMHKVWERTFRRAGIQLAYSQGFHPQPKIQQACPLPLGFTSSCELLDFWTKENGIATSICEALNRSLQPGITILDLYEVELNAPPLQSIVHNSEYLVKVLRGKNPEELSSSIQKFLQKESCIRERRGKTYDLRKMVVALRVESSTGTYFTVTMLALPGATGRPEELLHELGIPLEDTLIERTLLFFHNEKI